MNLDIRSRYSLRLQYALGRIAVLLIAPFNYLVLKLLGYRIEDLRKVRRSIRKAMDGQSGGWLICANHLTMVDSYIIAWALMPYGRYILDYRSVPWNLPERTNFQKNIFLAALCYLTKCIPITRGGDRGEVKRTMEKCLYLLESGSNLLIFPEGGRSRTGTIDKENFSYGVGRLAQKSPSARILCIYLRGLRQQGYSTIPRPGERFVVCAEEFQPEVATGGLKGQREIARQIVEKLEVMEEEWFKLAAGRTKHFSPVWIERMKPKRYPAGVSNHAQKA